MIVKYFFYIITLLLIITYIVNIKVIKSKNTKFNLNKSAKKVKFDLSNNKIYKIPANNKYDCKYYLDINNVNLNKMNNIQSNNVTNDVIQYESNKNNNLINSNYLNKYDDLNSNIIQNNNEIDNNIQNNISDSYITPNYDTKIINPDQIQNKKVDIKKIQDNILNNNSLNNTNKIKGIDGITQRDNNDKFLGEVQNSQVIREDKQVKFNNNLCDVNDPNYKSSLCYLNGTDKENNIPTNFTNNYIISNDSKTSESKGTKISLNNYDLDDDLTDINIKNVNYDVGDIIDVEKLNNVGIKEGPIYNPQKELLDRLNNSKIDDCSNVTDTWQDNNLNDFINQNSKEFLIDNSNININNLEYLNKSISEIYDELTNVEFQKIPNEFNKYQKIDSNTINDFM